MVSWWRMAFIFGPAIARGDISSFSLYTPFIFGLLLSHFQRGRRGGVLRLRESLLVSGLFCETRGHRCGQSVHLSPALPRPSTFDTSRGYRNGGVCVCRARTRSAVVGAVTRLWILAVPHGSCVGAGHLLGRVVKNLKNKVKLRGWPFKIPEDQLNGWRKRVALEVLGVFAFLAACHFLKAETRSLFNFFLSSFVCPMLRHWSCPNHTVAASPACATNHTRLPRRFAHASSTALLPRASQRPQRRRLSQS